MQLNQRIFGLFIVTNSCIIGFRCLIQVTIIFRSNLSSHSLLGLIHHILRKLDTSDSANISTSDMILLMETFSCNIIQVIDKTPFLLNTN